MALADLTKQLAQEMILSATKEPEPAARPAPVAGAADAVGAVLAGQIQAMQKALKDDEELMVWCQFGGEKIRVMEVFLPSPQVVVLTGLDAGRAMTRVVSGASAVQLAAKTAKVPPGSKPVRVAFVPKSKD
jgi:hypothetical protein